VRISHLFFLPNNYLKPKNGVIVMANIPCKLINAIGTRLSLRMYWGNDCPNAYGRRGGIGGHNAEKKLEDVVGEEIHEWIDPSLYDGYDWPSKCDHCDAAPNDEAVKNRQISRKTLYDNESGKPEPGDMYYAAYHHGEGKPHLCHWDNCDDPRGHLIVVLPTGQTWDIDSRASNCTMRDDRIHRCWVKHGEAPNVHVDKNGHTCQAGGGSIAVEGYHGFLQYGELTDC
jgi:hypothetical protein